MDGAQLVQFAVALVFVLALIAGAAAVARRFGLGSMPAMKSRRRRLTVAEILPLDGRRRLVLIRRDDREHLIILGPNSETVVERFIPVPETGEVPAKQRGPIPAVNGRLGDLLSQTRLGVLTAALGKARASQPSEKEL
jgi:flagellar protein FliO/FliZ